MKYIAYGSNLNHEQMARRCPAARFLEAFELDGWALVFRGVADIEPREGASVWVGAWEITDACERALDRYEGFPNMYRKEWLDVDGTEYMVYVMNSTDVRKPSSGYVRTIQDGYADCGMPTDAWLKLHAACRESVRAERAWA